MSIRKIIGIILIALMAVPTVLPWVFMTFILVSGILNKGLWSYSIIIGFIVSTSVYFVLNRYKDSLIAIKNFETMAVYELFGVKLFRNFTVPGDLMNLIIRRFELEPSGIQPKAFLLEIRQQNIFNEQIHWCGLIFSMFPLLSALYLHWYKVVFCLAGLTIIFNLYPILLQRYTRIRINKIAIKQD